MPQVQVLSPRPSQAGVAQLVEQLICNQQVGGSNPSTSSTIKNFIARDMGVFPSGQRGQTVNLLAYAYGGSNPPAPTKEKRISCLTGPFLL